MELRQLRYFVRTAELLSFSEAARQLFVTQSTLSQQIKALEGELDILLFDRNSHKVTLTELGEMFLPFARKTINDADESLERIQDIQQLATGELHIGCTQTFVQLLKDTLSNFMHIYPGIHIKVLCLPMADLIESLRRQEVDVVLSYKPTEKYPDIKSHILFDNRLAAVMSDTHPLAEHKSLSINDVMNYPVALPNTGMQARHTLERLLKKQEGTLDVRLEINNINILFDVIRTNRMMLTFVSQATTWGQTGLVTIPLEHDCPMEGSFHIRKDGYLKRSAREFLRLLCENKAYSMARMEI